jgi:hypothetical protein
MRTTPHSAAFTSAALLWHAAFKGQTHGQTRRQTTRDRISGPAI